ncbi:MAG TPA: hypothetical protein VK425_09940 [Acidimicrobiales bacterium]|nr:hypothetical protein [Acidimicrobiales bacterium]
MRTKPLSHEVQVAGGHPPPSSHAGSRPAPPASAFLWADAAWYRRERSGEMLGTLLEASPPGRRWPTFRDARALITGSFRTRGWVWLLSMLWVAVGAVITGYIFYATTHPYISADIDGTGIIGFSAGPAAVQIAAVLASVAWLTLPLPVLIAGLIRLRGWRPANWLRAAAWAGAWIAGASLLSLANAWGYSPGVSWGELQICAAWLVLGALMTWILGVPPARRSDVHGTSSQASSLASPPVPMERSCSRCPVRTLGPRRGRSAKDS